MNDRTNECVQVKVDVGCEVIGGQGSWRCRYGLGGCCLRVGRVGSGGVLRGGWVTRVRSGNTPPHHRCRSSIKVTSGPATPPPMAPAAPAGGAEAASPFETHMFARRETLASSTWAAGDAPSLFSASQKRLLPNSTTGLSRLSTQAQSFPPWLLLPLLGKPRRRHASPSLGEHVFLPSLVARECA